MENDTPLYTDEVKDIELFNLTVSMITLQKKIEGLNSSFEKLLSNYNELEKKNSIVVKEVEHIKLLGDELSRINSDSKSHKVVLNSIEFQTLIDYLVPIVEKSINAKMQSIFSETSGELKKSIEQFKKEQNEIIEVLSATNAENIALKKELMKKTKELHDTRDSIFYLTNYLQEFREEVKKLYPIKKQSKKPLPKCKKENNRPIGEPVERENKKTISKDEKDSGFMLSFFSGLFGKGK